MDYELRNFEYTASHNLWSGIFKEHLGIIGCSTDIDISQMSYDEMQTNKPVYLGFMASMQQLQPILDNPHLFDANVIAAVQALKVQYDKLKIE